MTLKMNEISNKKCGFWRRKKIEIAESFWEETLQKTVKKCHERWKERH